MKRKDQTSSSKSARPVGAARKRRRGSLIAFEMIRLDRSVKEPLHLQLYRQIRDELSAGNFASARLPSSRALAGDLGVSRLTVNLAFEKLEAEGYLETRKGSGTFVAQALPETFLNAARIHLPPRDARPPRIANRILHLPDPRNSRQLDVGAAGPPGVTFVPGLPAVDEFPIGTWERLRAKVLAKKGAHLLRYASSRGDADLRQAIATYLCDFRGARCHPGQIVIVAATQQAMLISALALLNRGDVAWIEDPGFRQAIRAFTFVEAKLVPKPVDEEGLVLKRAPNERSPRIIFVTPSHQFPLGMTMSLARRRALIDFARARDAYILEDDYNSEFRFNGPPLPSLQGLDDAGRVIYSGTMSKILHPAMRLGYLVAPEPLVDSLVKIRAVIDQHSSPTDQATLAHFVNEGFFLSHVKRMRKVYAERREVFIEQFNKSLGNRFTLQIPEAGLHFVAWAKSKEEMDLVQRAGLEVGITPVPLSIFCLKAQLPPALIFGFAAWSSAQIREGLIKLARETEKFSLAKKAGRPVPLRPARSWPLPLLLPGEAI